MATTNKYQSELHEVLYEDALADFEVGAISEARMREYDEMCLAKPAAQVPRVPTQKPAAVPRSGAPAYARGK